MAKHQPKHDDQPGAAEPARREDDGQPAEAVSEAAGEQGNPLEQLRADLEGAKDRVLRSQAELENYRKRAAREIEDHRRYANLPLLHDLLPVLDSIQRAIDAADRNAPNMSSFLAGIEIVLEHLKGVLARYNCVEIDAMQKPFNPHLHEAISQQPSEEFPANTVLFVVRPGFQLFDRVVRPSQVIVSSASAPPPPGEE